MATNEVERFVDEETGKVVVLIGSGYGAYWSSYIRNDQHTEIVMAVLDGNREEAARIPRAKIPNFSVNGKWTEDLVVEWVDKGEEFWISEYNELLARATLPMTRGVKRYTDKNTKKVAVKWVDQGEESQVGEYDGYESFIFMRLT
ncbi:MAG: hypothetical protein Q9201_006331 [Fulgogasparrea decipioides]